MASAMVPSTGPGSDDQSLRAKIGASPAKTVIALASAADCGRRARATMDSAAGSRLCSSCTCRSGPSWPCRPPLGMPPQRFWQTQADGTADRRVRHVARAEHAESGVEPRADPTAATAHDHQRGGGSAHRRAVEVVLAPRSSPASAVTTTGRYSGRQPAATAFTAICSTVTVRDCSRRFTTTSPGGARRRRSPWSTSSTVGGMIGRPSDQPLTWNSSWLLRRGRPPRGGAPRGRASDS